MFGCHQYEEGEEEEAMAITTGSCIQNDWRQPMITYLQLGKLPDDVQKKIDIRRRAPRFVYDNPTGPDHQYTSTIHFLGGLSGRFC
ncbi:hypothetical protein LIER_27405 [Lithospermum erythrorhizon]|uniref:Uncharacterized protein n=1 Tax=Lithospermum erythrorhizon TaxID=34254 RepID=A0AAV3RG13_LITER